MLVAAGRGTIDKVRVREGLDRRVRLDRKREVIDISSTTCHTVRGAVNDCKFTLMLYFFLLLYVFLFMSGILGLSVRGSLRRCKLLRAVKICPGRVIGVVIQRVARVILGNDLIKKLVKDFLILGVLPCVLGAECLRQTKR